jgi:hypothetical protein
MPPQDQFNGEFDIATQMASGYIKYKKADQLEFLCAFIVQLDDSGEVQAGAFGGEWNPAAIANLIADTGGPATTDNPPQAQPTWSMGPLRLMDDPKNPNPEIPRPSEFIVGREATGVALYRLPGAQVEGWATGKITVTNNGSSEPVLTAAAAGAGDTSSQA